MFLKIVFICLLFVNTNADTLLNSIQNIVGQKNYQLNRVLIYSLFKNKRLFYIGKSHLKYERILKILNNKGLLHIRYNSPKTINIEIESKSKSLKMIMIINDILNSLGFSYYFTQDIQKQNGQLNWTITLKSESMIDPYIFVKELNKLEVNILEVQRINKLKWKYTINSDYAKMSNTVSILNNEKVRLQKPLKAYMLEIKKASVLQVLSRRLNTWFPYISFYNKDFKLLDQIEKKKIYKGIKVDIPFNTKYIKIDDVYTLLNIKRGLTIIVR
jgi:hypothetical protein